MKSNFTKLMSMTVAAVAVSSAVNAGTLDDVKAKGFVQCGVSQGVPGFSNADIRAIGQVSMLMVVVRQQQRCLVMHKK